MRTFLFVSKSSPSSRPHAVRTHDDGTVVSCSCRGFSTPNGCWHIKTVDEAFKSGDLSMLVEKGAPAAPAPPAQPALFELDYIPSAPPAPLAPMLASALDEEKSIEDYGGPEWVLEEKYDGWRLLLAVAHQAPDVTITAWTRTGNLFPLPIHIALAARYLPDGLFDGEVYLPGGTSTDVRRLDVQDRLRLVLFDILKVGSASAATTDEAQHVRRTLLEMSTRELEGDSVTIAPQFPVTRDGLQAIWNRGGEGAVIKARSGRYVPGARSTSWIKFKRFHTGRATITGFLAGLLGPCSRVEGVDKNGVTVRAKAKNDEWRAKFEKDQARYIGKTLVFEHQGQASKGKYRSPMADHVEE